MTRVEGTVAQIFSRKAECARWLGAGVTAGYDTSGRPSAAARKPPLWTSSLHIAARLRRLEPFAVAIWDLGASELSKATVGRPKTKLAGPAVDRSRSAA